MFWVKYVLNQQDFTGAVEHNSTGTHSKSWQKLPVYLLQQRDHPRHSPEECC